MILLCNVKKNIDFCEIIIYHYFFTYNFLDMKKLIFFLIITIMSIPSLNAQTSFSCSYREYCDWNATTEKFENCEGYEESSLFVMNEAQTMFTHTIATMKSTYFINSKEYDAKTNNYIYDVTSDVGNKYYYMFDVSSKTVTALIIKDGKTTFLTFTVKAVF